MDDRPMTVPEVAEYLQVHPETVLRWIRAGRLRAFSLGHKLGYRVRQAEIERFVTEREQPNALIAA